MDSPVGVRQKTGGHRPLDHLVALWSFLDEHTAGKEEGVGGGVHQLLLAGGGLTANASGHVFETAGLQFEIELAVIGEDQFVVASSLEPYMPIGLSVAGFAIVGNFIRGENVVLVFDPDVADQRIDLSLLLLLPGFEAHGDTRGRRGNQFSNRIIGRVRKRRWAWIRGKLLGQRLRPKLEMTQH